MTCAVEIAKMLYLIFLSIFHQSDFLAQINYRHTQAYLKDYIKICLGYFSVVVMAPGVGGES